MVPSRRLLGLAAAVLLAAGAPRAALAGSCSVAAGGGTLHLSWPGDCDAAAWPRHCAALAAFSELPAPPWDAATAATLTAALRGLGDFSAVRCTADARAAHCALEPLPMVVSSEVTGPLPVALVREDLRRRLFLRPGTVVAQLSEARARQEERVMRALEGEGFFDGHAHVAVRPVDGAAPLAGLDVDVQVDAGHPAHVAATRLRGVVGEHAEAILAAFSHTAFLWFGQARFRPLELDADAEHAAAILRDAGYPAALVRASFTHAPGSAAVTLCVHVERGPHLDLRFIGNTTLGDGALRAATTFRSAGALDAVEVENSRRAIVQLYEEAGFDSAAVDSSVRRVGDDMAVVFTIAEGARRQVTEVTVVTEGGGDGALDGAALAKQAGLLTRANGLLRHGLVGTWVSHDIGALQAAARAHGYTQASVRVEHAALTDATLAVRFFVRLGVQTRVSALRLVGVPADVDVAALSTTLRTRAGAPLPQAADLDHDQDALHAALTARGYLHAEVETALSPPGPPLPAQVEVCLRAQPGPQLRRGGLLLRGATRTRPSVIEHELRMDPDALLDVPALGAARRRLRALNLFTNVQLRPVSARPEGHRPWLQVRVQEREVRSLDAVVGVSSDDGWSVGADFRDRNVFGRALAIDAELRLANASHALGPWRIGTTDRVQVRGHVPRPLGLPLDVGANVAYRLEDRALYRLQQVGGGASLSRTLLARDALPHAPALLGRVGYELLQGAYREKVASDTQIYRGALRLPSAIIGRVYVSLDAEARDAPLDPRAGYAGALRVELAEPALARPLFADGASFWRLQASAQGILTLARLATRLAPTAPVLGGPLVLAVGAQYGAAGPLGSHDGVPASETYAYGGDFSVRGMPPRGSSAAFLAHYMLTGSAELRWYVVTFGIGTLQLGGFIDAGTIARAPLRLLRDTTVTAGPVARYVTAVGPLSLAYGWPLQRAADLRDLTTALPPHGRLHITLGYNF